MKFFTMPNRAIKQINIVVAMPMGRVLPPMFANLDPNERVDENL